MSKKITFHGERAFEATHKAEAWCRENGYSVGTMQRGSPRGLLRGDFDIQKWRNLGQHDRDALDGVMTGDGRNGPVHVEIFGDQS